MKLLAPKGFALFEPIEYHEYIRSLNKPKEFTSTKKDQKDLKVRIKRKKNGTLSIVTRRNPAYITAKEIEKISAESQIAQNEIFLAIKERNITIYPDHKAAAQG